MRAAALLLVLAACRRDPQPELPRERPPQNGIVVHENRHYQNERLAELEVLRDRGCACTDAACAAEVERDHEAWTDRGLDANSDERHGLGVGPVLSEGETMEMGKLADDLDRCLARFQ